MAFGYQNGGQNGYQNGYQNGSQNGCQNGSQNGGQNGWISCPPSAPNIPGIFLELRVANPSQKLMPLGNIGP